MLRVIPVSVSCVHLSALLCTTQFRRLSSRTVTDPRFRSIFVFYIWRYSIVRFWMDLGAFSFHNVPLKRGVSLCCLWMRPDKAADIISGQEHMNGARSDSTVRNWFSVIYFGRWGILWDADGQSNGNVQIFSEAAYNSISDWYIT